MLTHKPIVLYTWWCWHIYKGEVVGVETDQLREDLEVISVTGLYIAEVQSIKRGFGRCLLVSDVASLAPDPRVTLDRTQVRSLGSSGSSSTGYSKPRRGMGLDPVTPPMLRTCLTIVYGLIKPDK